ncbi:hypothetical protein GRZ55_03980 [Chelativorans sp. ZYF759]|uniref:helix-turn-helix domain-containing protein n=1 Tax=Chelativorans sp. ZYF759 TaxID=2692213 RepID=UPI00145D5EE1|nr:helix-turn-helix transcriptional regulator [Chelativorans sp. ZYF759]NMG38399.1 hypothetical protein [Chelativorans sp. ZYF759]
MHENSQSDLNERPSNLPPKGDSIYALDLRKAGGTYAESMMTSSYGKALGELILQKRRATGLTQLQLAEDAYSDPTKVRRISELENGLVANPHPKTIDPIISVLHISSEEVEECAKRTGGRIDPDLDRAYREARNLIEALAYQFEHEHPDASFAELDEFLREKATEWRQLRARLDTIDETSDAIAQAKRSATEALAHGKLDEVDVTLAALEALYQERHTLLEVAKQSEIRVTRGDTCLMKGDAEGAFGHYFQAARFFQPFSESEMARVLDENAHRVYESSIRMLRPRFWIGVRLLEELLRLDIVEVDIVRRRSTHYRLGLLYRNAAAHSSDGDEEDSLQHAVKHARLAADQLSEDDDPFTIVSAKVSLANCLLDLGKRHPASNELDEAIATLRSAKVIALEEDTAGSLLCHIYNSLGGALNSRIKGDDFIHSEAAIREALEEFEAAIVSSERSNNPDVWGAANFNRGRLLAALAQQEDRNISERTFLFVQAVSAYQAAIETYPETLFPDRFAGAHFELGSTLFHFALIAPDYRTELYMFRSVQSFDIAGAIYAHTHSWRWAECQLLSGSLIARHAHLDTALDPESDLNEAIRRYETAMEVYQQEKDAEQVQACARAIESAQRQLTEKHKRA